MDVETTVDVHPADYKGSNTGNQRENHVNSTYHNTAFIHEQTSDVAAVPSANDVGAPSDSARENSNVFRYGWLCLTCDILQHFNKPIVFLLCVCLAAFAQGAIVVGITSATVTSIEKQFGLTSSQVGLFTTMCNAAAGVCSLFIGYLCTSHKPRYIAYGILLMAAGTVIICIPKFIADDYTSSYIHYDGFCSRGNGTQSIKGECTISQSSLYQLLFNIGYILLGAGAQPLFIIAPAHIEEITQRGQGSIYLGVFYTSLSVGIGAGYVIGMGVLQTWVDIEKPKPDWNPSHPNWVGAWWLAFLTGAAILLLPLVLMLGIPQKFPDTDNLRIAKRAFKDTVQEDNGLNVPWLSLKALLKNKPYVLITLVRVTENLSLGGFALFIPKFFATQFHFTSSDSILHSSIVVIPGVLVGTLLGGYLVKKFQWNSEDILKYGSIATFITTLLTLFVLVGCDSGTTDLPTAIFPTKSTCNVNCNCALIYQPICVVDEHKVYYSPCHAGCIPGNKISVNKFQNCSCFSLNTTYAEKGSCTPESCPLLPLSMVGFFLVIFFVSINNVPYKEVTMRLVNEGQGSAANALEQLLTSLLGAIPSPVLYGALIDQACILWKDGGCGGESANCLEYNIDNFRYYLFALLFAANSLSFIFTLLAFKLYKAPVRVNECSSKENEGVTSSTL